VFEVYFYKSVVFYKKCRFVFVGITEHIVMTATLTGRTTDDAK
jgi:hypothetical protein